MVLRWGREIRGLEDAVWMIGAYLAVAAVLGYLISMFRDVSARRERKELTDRLLLAARSDFRAAVSFCKGHT